jgi:transcriptional regulator with XRE-family HTH domain
MKLQLIKLGDRLRSLRRDAHKSQYELAAEWRALGVPITRDMIANWETNRAQIPARFIPLIAFSLNAGVTDLLPELRISAFADVQRLSASVGASRKSTNHTSRASKRHARRTHRQS